MVVALLLLPFLVLVAQLAMVLLLQQLIVLVPMLQLPAPTRVAVAPKVVAMVAVVGMAVPSTPCCCCCSPRSSATVVAKGPNRASSLACSSSKWSSRTTHD